MKFEDWFKKWVFDYDRFDEEMQKKREPTSFDRSAAVLIKGAIWICWGAAMIYVFLLN